MPNHYNIALHPSDDELIEFCIDLARANLSEQSDGYLLGNDAIPHITLSQFEAEGNLLPAIWAKVGELPAPTIRFGHIYIMPGTKRHDGFNWVGLDVKQTVELSELQKDVVAQLALCSVTGTTKTESYYPHLTLGRCRADTPLAIGVFPANQFWKTEHSFHMSIGLSNENGVYQEQLFARKRRSEPKRRSPNAHVRKWRDTPDTPD